MKVRAIERLENIRIEKFREKMKTEFLRIRYFEVLFTFFDVKCNLHLDDFVLSTDIEINLDTSNEFLNTVLLFRRKYNPINIENTFMSALYGSIPFFHHSIKVQMLLT